ncbi:stress response protein NST1-like [Amphibalanus amphitrite]|uniref:stress response protein NST1-like n=1 Tax=Amphibalanus amphitrite TaxID=1232801 RepID=UPI001C912E82|nr:stress response protein NST1-like [Amphibalanus amphitrite]
MEERRQKQERDRNNLLMFQQQQSGGGGGLGFGGDGGGGRRRPHVSETDSVQATLQQQIAEKKQREAERKRMEAEEDAALNARLEEQQRKVREEAEREQEARKAKERGRLERQRLIEEQQKRSHDEAEAMKKAARDRRQGAQGSATVNDWGSWAADDRPAGKAAAPPEEDLWQAPAVEESPPRAPSPPAVESKPDTPPPEIHPSQDTSDLKIGFRWDRPQTERPEMRLDSPQLDDLAKRNRDRQRRLEERKKAGQ